MKEWMDCFWTDQGILVAHMKVERKPTLVKVMVGEWLHRYRQLAHVLPPHNTSNNPPTSRISEGRPDLSSDEGETDDE